MTSNFPAGPSSPAFLSMAPSPLIEKIEQRFASSTGLDLSLVHLLRDCLITRFGCEILAATLEAMQYVADAGPADLSEHLYAIAKQHPSSPFGSRALILAIELTHHQTSVSHG